MRLVGLDWQLLPHGTAELLAELGDPPTAIAGLREVAAGSGTDGALKALDRWELAARSRPALAEVVGGLRGWHDSLARLAVDPLDLDGYCARDIWMGRRCLEVVAEDPNAKAIVWAASFHAARGSHVMNGQTSEELAFSALTLMGDVVAEGLGTKAKVIALTAAGGEFGLASWPEARSIPEPPADSLEQACMAAGLEAALVEPPSSPMVARPFGYQPMAARWAEVVDAFLFVPHMDRAHPSH
jgi:hypothetical protein